MHRRRLSVLVTVVLVSSLLSCGLARPVFAETQPASDAFGAVSTSEQALDVEKKARPSSDFSYASSWRYDNGTLTAQKDQGVELYAAPSGRPEGATAWGVDVSWANKAIDWKKVKADGVDFAIIRLGYGWGGDDSQFINNVRGCRENGIPFGVYLYSYAWDSASASAEAEWALQVLGNAGVFPGDLTFPVFYDLENEHDGKPAGVDDNNQYRYIQGGPKTFASMARAFCDKIAGKGYTPGVYANLNWWRSYLTDSAFDGWARWVAQYSSTCDYSGSYVMWQYSSSGAVSGINGRVDTNWYYGGMASPGWYLKDGSWYYRLSDGSNRTGWLTEGDATYWLDPARDGACASGITEVDGALYRFDPARGLAMTRGLFSEGGNTYYADPASGRLVSGWVFAEGEWYCFDASSGCAARTGWYEEGGRRYHLRADGVADRGGWATVDGSWYCFDWSCAALTGWLWDESEWYCLDGSGRMRTGWYEEGGRRYHLRADGAADRGEWAWIGSEWYCFDWSGAQRRGWYRECGDWFLLAGDDAHMARGSFFYEGRWSRFDYSGRWKGYASRSWVQAGDGWYYADEGGYPASGWRWVGSEWYYLDPADRGRMKTGWFEEGGSTYYCKSSGAMARGWASIEGSWYYFNYSGVMQTGWLTLNGSRYYLGKDGVLLTGIFTVDGVRYYADSNGALLSGVWVDDHSGSRVFVGKSGKAALWMRDGKLYSSEDLSAIVSGQIDVDGYRFLVRQDGTPITGWYKDAKSRWFYYDPASCYQRRGWISLDGTWYFLDRSTGVMATGWIFTDNYWYLLNPSGSLRTGWYKEAGYWYYLAPDWGGAMLTGTHMVEGYRRRFDYSGHVDKYGYQNPSQYYQVSSWNVKPYRADAGIFSYVSPCRIGVEATRSQVVEAFIARAYDYLGTKYVWDYACAPGVGIDCAGLVNQCFYAVGMDTIYNPYLHWHDPWQDHNAENMRVDAKLKHVSFSERQRGDLIFYPGHVAIYLGNDQIIEAYPPSVQISSVYRHSPITGVARPFV